MITPVWAVVGAMILGFLSTSYDRATFFGDDEGNVLMGEFLDAAGTEFSITVMGERQTLNLAADGKVTGPDGKSMQLKDIKAGQAVRVSTKKNEPQIATVIEVLT